MIRKFFVLYCLFAFVACVGWVMNLFDVVHLAVHNAPFGTLFIVRAFGVVAFPLGAVMGWY